MKLDKEAVTSWNESDNKIIALYTPRWCGLMSLKAVKMRIKKFA